MLTLNHFDSLSHDIDHLNDLLTSLRDMIRTARLKPETLSLSIEDIFSVTEQAMQVGRQWDIPFARLLNAEDLTWDLHDAPEPQRGDILTAWMQPAITRIQQLRSWMLNAPQPCLYHVDGQFERLTGATDRHQIWVFDAEGHAIAPQIDRPYASPSRSHERHREWFFLPTTAVVIAHRKATTTSAHECTWLYRPALITPAQAAALQEVAETLEAQWPTTGSGNWLGRVSPPCLGWLTPEPDAPLAADAPAPHRHL